MATSDGRQNRLAEVQLEVDKLKRLREETGAELDMTPRTQLGGLADARSVVWQPAAKFEISSNLQPIFKLHGSLLVMGADKTATIQEKSILPARSASLRLALVVRGRAGLAHQRPANQRPKRGESPLKQTPSERSPC